MYFSTLVTLALSATTAFAAPALELEERQSCSPRGISSSDKSRVVSAFRSQGVNAALGINLNNPTVKVSVTYPAKAVNLGNRFTTAQTLTQPSYSITAEQNRNPSTTTYSFFMIDPDVPSPNSPVRATYLHWYVAKNKPSCISGSPGGDTVTVYQSPSPASTAQHRYTFLAYREPSGYTPNRVTAQVRAGLNINSYASAGGLVLVGGNFFKEAITNT